MFRDPAKSDVLRDKLDAADAAIAKRCFLKTAKTLEAGFYRSARRDKTGCALTPSGISARLPLHLSK